ncbi:hypothetical protein ACX0G9_30780 [Flavitalea flava]
MLKELDVIKANREMSEQVPKGTKEVIHQIYLNHPIFYLVEFIDNENNTICILEVSEKDIELV